MQEVIELRREKRRKKPGRIALLLEEQRLAYSPRGPLEEPYVGFGDVWKLPRVQKHLFVDDAEYELSCDDL